MYKRILLASDGTRESLVTLREGVLMSKALGAEVFLLIVEAPTVSETIANSVYAAPRNATASLGLLRLGLERLDALGVRATGELVTGEPSVCIARRAKAFEADLIVVGHRRRTLMERWWSGSAGAYLVDIVACSVLVARDTITDAEFERHLAGLPTP